jgi:hypothetical protein
METSMSARRRLVFPLAYLMVAGTVPFATNVQFVRTQDSILSDQILNAPKNDEAEPLGRPEAAHTPDQANFLDPFRNRTASSLAPEERQKLATLASDSLASTSTSTSNLIAHLARRLEYIPREVRSQKRAIKGFAKNNGR